ncbi:DEAD/DEAH box helicase family protein [Hoeflea alexandrii]|uniref:DEAD/DEAH box helicase family protein n=1 Tax=Hoeflea alexandrii TaxID=288436 RepID=A0ABT1CTG5_9HYPH|nr:DEAD/DEAH box helicase family protein [Hoeflea alexandrii]MCO6409484.1 DEAD/DEAH box helicase family protein [Hoeflea alexandrii]MCY0152515.1 DEAD/DEAH box helicase family protein [Hoeflea alexandrii]
MSAHKEATARIKINKLLEEAGWRFFESERGPANIVLEPNVKLKNTDIEALGTNFEKAKNGFIDFLLLDADGKPLIVLEAKSEEKHPLSAKEQARKYARSQNARFVILSNGIMHFLWDLEQGNPSVISKFPGPDDIKNHYAFEPNAGRLSAEPVGLDFIALTQMPGYANEAAWKNEAERPAFIEKQKLRFLRKYQQRAIERIQEEAKKGATRFLFEMATGTGKTLTSAAVVKLFLKTRNAKRVLFLVDRLELETQADKAFKALLKNDFTSIIYKEQRDDWRKADIVVTTVQSLLFNDKYRRLFSPTDFDLVISDEAHRSIGGNARAVFEYFIGYKLGLTATPKDYLKQSVKGKTSERDPRESERRMMLDTYKTFGCESGDPTYRYSLLDGVRDGFLINPYVVDARTGVTTQLLSEEGFTVETTAEDGTELKEAFAGRDFEKRFFAEATNQVFCRALLEHGMRDPISGEFGKTIAFAVSQNHAAKITQILNTLADQLWPGRYQSDFAMQVTSDVTHAQKMTINFANNNLAGHSDGLENYRTSKARVCVTVGMMTTGYDCPDLLNLALMRPIFSPSDFVQMKGRGTRKHNFSEEMFDPAQKTALGDVQKTAYRLFDFFANCEFFEEEFQYDQELKLPKPAAMPLTSGGDTTTTTTTAAAFYEFLEPDQVVYQFEQQIGPEGMRVDRELFKKFEDMARSDKRLAELVEQQNWETATRHVIEELFDKPDEYFNLERLRRAAGVDRRITIRELIEKAFGFIPKFKSKAELIDDEFQKFLLDQKPEEADRVAQMRYFFEAYIRDAKVRALVDAGHFGDLNVNPTFTTRDLKEVPAAWRRRIPEYIKDYVSLNPFL